MFRSRRGARLEFAGSSTEPDYLTFVDGLLGDDLRTSVLTYALTAYCERFLAPTASRTPADWAFAFWDALPVERVLRLVSYRGFRASPDTFPRILHYHDGPLGHLAAEKRSRRGPVVIRDLSEQADEATDLVSARELGFRGALVLPLHNGKELLGIFCVFYTLPFDESILSNRLEFRVHASRLGIAIQVAVMRSAGLFRETLALEFGDATIEAVADAEVAERQVAALIQRVTTCLHLTAVMVDALAARVTIHSLKEPFASFERVSRRDPASLIENNKILIPLTQSAEDTIAQIGELLVDQKTDGTYFSRVDIRVLNEAAAIISRYLSKYLAIGKISETYRVRLSKQQGLLKLSDAAAGEFMNANGIEAVAASLIQLVGLEFNVKAALYLEYDPSTHLLRPAVSVPVDYAGALRTRHPTLQVRERCLLVDKVDWEIADCAACRGCSGVTTIAALRGAKVVVDPSMRARLGKVYIEPGFDCDAEILLPLQCGGRLFGVLDVYTADTHNLGSEENHFLTLVANVAAQAIYVKYLHGELDEAYRQSTRGDVARDVVHTLAPTVASLDTALNLLHASLRPLRGQLRDRTQLRTGAKEAIEMLDFVTDVVRQQHNVVARYDLTARGRHTGKPEDVFIKDVVTDVIALNSLKAHDKKVWIKRTSSGTVRAVKASRGDMFLVIWNLIHNAIKFARGDKDTDLIIHEQYEATAVTLTVKDQGVGIRPSDESRIWDMGFSTRAPGAAEATGGLGLYIVRELAKGFSAQVDLKSTIYGRGSEFAITIAQREGKKS